MHKCMKTNSKLGRRIEYSSSLAEVSMGRKEEDNIERKVLKYSMIK